MFNIPTSLIIGASIALINRVRARFICSLFSTSVITTTNSSPPIRAVQSVFRAVSCNRFAISYKHKVTHQMAIGIVNGFKFIKVKV